MLGSMYVAFVKFALQDICRFFHVSISHVTRRFVCKLVQASAAEIYYKGGVTLHVRVRVLFRTFCLLLNSDNIDAQVRLHAQQDMSKRFT